MIKDSPNRWNIYQPRIKLSIWEKSTQKIRKLILMNMIFKSPVERQISPFESFIMKNSISARANLKGGKTIYG